MKISELISELQEIQNEHGDVEALAVFDTYGEGEWVSLEEDGISFDRFNEGKKLYILVGDGIPKRQTNKEPDPA